MVNQLGVAATAALDTLRSAIAAMHAFVDANADPDGDEPAMGYARWDESMADYRERVSDAAEALADTLSDALPCDCEHSRECPTVALCPHGYIDDCDFCHPS